MTIQEKSEGRREYLRQKATEAREYLQKRLERDHILERIQYLTGKKQKLINT